MDFKISAKVKMLALAAATAVAAPLAAQACPTLQGDYTCSALGGIVTLEIPVQQSTDKAGITTYILDGAPVIADGAAHKAQTLPNLLARFVKDVTYQAACQKGGVQFAGRGTLLKNGEPANINGFLSQRDANSLTIDMVLNSSSGQKNVSADCVKN